MRGLYPEHLDYLLPGDIEILREEILKAHLSWDNTHSSGSSHDPHQDTDGTHIPSDNTQISGADTTTQVADNPTNHSGRRRRSAVSDSCKLSYQTAILSRYSAFAEEKVVTFYDSLHFI